MHETKSWTTKASSVQTLSTRPGTASTAAEKSCLWGTTHASTYLALVWPVSPPPAIGGGDFCPTDSSPASQAVSAPWSLFAVPVQTPVLPPWSPDRRDTRQHTPPRHPRKAVIQTFITAMHQVTELNHIEQCC